MGEGGGEGEGEGERAHESPALRAAPISRRPTTRRDVWRDLVGQAACGWPCRTGATHPACSQQVLHRVPPWQLGASPFKTERPVHPAATDWLAGIGAGCIPLWDRHSLRIGVTQCVALQPKQLPGMQGLPAESPDRAGGCDGEAGSVCVQGLRDDTTKWHAFSGGGKGRCHSAVTCMCVPLPGGG